jgi:hypothetical protein
MGLFSRSKSTSSKGELTAGIDLSSFFFMSSDHIRYQSGEAVTGPNPGCYRGICVSERKGDYGTYDVAILKQDSPHPVWNDNYTMIPKRMGVEEVTDKAVVLRGCGLDSSGISYEDYGLTLRVEDGEVASVVLHMHDRDVDIHYLP